MTTHELAKKLLEGPDVIATVRGYEGGVFEIREVNEPTLLCLNTSNDDEWWFGPHDYCNYSSCGHENKTLAVHITGARK